MSLLSNFLQRPLVFLDGTPENYCPWRNAWFRSSRTVGFIPCMCTCKIASVQRHQYSPHSHFGLTGRPDVSCPRLSGATRISTGLKHLQFSHTPNPTSQVRPAVLYNTLCPQYGNTPWAPPTDPEGKAQNVGHGRREAARASEKCDRVTGRHPQGVPLPNKTRGRTIIAGTTWGGGMTELFAFWQQFTDLILADVQLVGWGSYSLVRKCHLETDRRSTSLVNLHPKRYPS